MLYRVTLYQGSTVHYFHSAVIGFKEVFWLETRTTTISIDDFSKIKSVFDPRWVVHYLCTPN